VAAIAVIDEREPLTSEDIEPWELHSELVLVCPEVGQRARELLSEHDPNAFLTRPREPVLLPAGIVDEPRRTTSTPFPVAIIGYAAWRLLGTARIALFTIGGVVAVALLAELLH
jgi:hypothetical protein